MDRSTCHAYSNLASEPSNNGQRQLTVYSIYLNDSILYILYNLIIYLYYCLCTADHVINEALLIFLGLLDFPNGLIPPMWTLLTVGLE